MRILLIGAGGKLGSAVNRALSTHGHDMVTVGRTGGDLRYDVTDPAQVGAMYESVGPVDAVVGAAGATPFAPVAELSLGDYRAAFESKVLSQIDLVRQGLAHVSERGSFTLIGGVLGHDPIPDSATAAMANGAVESFVLAAAIDIAPRRINAVSPTVFTESMADYGDFFPGVEPVGLNRVAGAYVRSVEGGRTGQVYVLE